MDMPSSKAHSSKLKLFSRLPCLNHLIAGPSHIHQSMGDNMSFEADGCWVHKAHITLDLLPHHQA
eukprot:5030652-Ditylum_brightwellii.AAC.1